MCLHPLSSPKDRLHFHRNTSDMELEGNLYFFVTCLRSSSKQRKILRVRQKSMRRTQILEIQKRAETSPPSILFTNLKYTKESSSLIFVFYPT